MTTNDSERWLKKSCCNVSLKQKSCCNVSLKQKLEISLNRNTQIPAFFVSE
jgi:hypothetical protein